MTTSNGVLGKAVRGTLSADQVEWWPLPDTVSVAGASGSELQAVCPVTEQPDIYDFAFTFTGVEPESKSLKMYLLSFRDRPISCAQLAHTLVTELARAGRGGVGVTLQQQTRGGMRLAAVAAVGVEGVQL